MSSPVLAVAFGNGSQALIVTTTEILLLNPATGMVQSIGVSPQSISTSCLPVPFATFPPSITQAAVGTSGDGNTVVVVLSVSATSSSSGGSGSGSGPSGSSGTTGGCGLNGTTPAVSSTVAVFSYAVGTSAINFGGWLTSPALGPRMVAVDQYGQNYLTGWILSVLPGAGNYPFTPGLAQFPYPTGVLNIGGAAWDWVHNRIFAQVPSATEGPVLSVVDTDNLTVEERIQLNENLAGQSVWSSDMQTLYAVSVSGVTVFNMGGFNSSHRVSSLEEDVVFQGNGCNQGVITQTVDIVDRSGGSVDFSLSLPAGMLGVQMSSSSGTTPAHVRITVDPGAFQAGKGTTAIPLTISSQGSINLGATVRLLIATPDVTQHGQVIDVPGKITDILADPVRNRVYLTRQDKNLILVYDATSYQQIASFRTGNTPVGMTITADNNYLVVGNDNSQIDNVYDLNAMQPAGIVLLTPGLYGRSLATASNGQIFQIVRSATTLTAPYPPCATACVVSLNLASGLATPPATLGIFANSLSSPNGILAASPDNNTILMALPDGTVALYDATAGQWVASRQDFHSLGGAAGAFTDNQFLVDNHVLDAALVPAVDLENTSGSSSGIALASGAGLRTTTSAANNPGFIERVDMTSFQTYHGALTEEASAVQSILQTAPVGQIGETILPFVRSLAIPANQNAILSLSVSGMTLIENNFDAPTPLPAISGLVNAADGTSAVAPGGLVIVQGIGLAPGTAIASQVPLPEQLGNVCVTANNIPIPLFNVASSQIMAQLPFTVSGSTPLVVKTPGGVSNTFTANVSNFAPAIFHSGEAGGQTGIPTVVRSTNNELVTFTNPIHPDEMIFIYLTGLAQTSPLPDLGAASPSNPLAEATTPPTVMLGSVSLPVVFAGLVPGEVGVYLIDAYVPKNIQNSDATALTINQGPGTTTYMVRTVNP